MRLLSPLAAVMSLALVAAVSAADMAAQKKSGGPHARPAMIELLPDGMTWGPAPAGLPADGQSALLEGDPSKPGYFAVRLKGPAGYKIMPHWHGGFERITVISGTFALGMGDTYDESKLKTYPPGSYISMPKGMRHFAQFKSDCVVQLASLGPWNITYVDPKDDPRKQSAK